MLSIFGSGGQGTTGCKRFGSTSKEAARKGSRLSMETDGDITSSPFSPLNSFRVRVKKSLTSFTLMTSCSLFFVLGFLTFLLPSSLLLFFLALPLFAVGVNGIMAVIGVGVGVRVGVAIIDKCLPPILLFLDFKFCFFGPFPPFSPPPPSSLSSSLASSSPSSPTSRTRALIVPLATRTAATTSAARTSALDPDFLDPDFVMEREGKGGPSGISGSVWRRDGLLEERGREAREEEGRGGPGDLSEDAEA
mmetsp:Transcript_31500/g.57222  ORF Transcript_31500/g.57222 Transcript_31500/m.57222 type:complete len:249 (-) Transcript_31500:275-1021(-)